MIRPGIYTKEIDLSSIVLPKKCISMITGIYDKRTKIEDGIYINCPKEYDKELKEYLIMGMKHFCEKHELAFSEDNIFNKLRWEDEK